MIKKKDDEPRSDALIPPPGVVLLTGFAHDVIKAQGDGEEIVRAVRDNLKKVVGHNVHAEDVSPLRLQSRSK